MTIEPGTRLHGLLKRYPFLQTFLPGLSPKFGALNQPLARNLLLRTVTLEKVADMGGMEIERLMREIAAEIRTRTAEEVDVRTATAHPDLLRDIIRDLHRGVPVDQVKGRFSELVQEVAPGEIAEMEQALMKEGIPQEDIKRLCDVHVEVFRESLEKREVPAAPAGHPVHTYMAENRQAEALLAKVGKILEGPLAGNDWARLEILVRDELARIERHYLRKENQLFPLLESRGIGGPTEVMWSIHDDIRALLKTSRQAVEGERLPEAREAFGELRRKVEDMIYKEEHILFPLALETLTDPDWAQVRRGEEEIGFAWVTPGTTWKPEPPERWEGAPADDASRLKLNTGELTPELVDLLLSALPVDVTFVNEHDRVLYYSGTPERIFPRTPAIIGRRVQNCHPPASVHVVERILKEFKAGRREAAEFWIRMEGRFIHIRYFPIRDRQGKYRGTLEVSQDVTGIRGLEGERRLLDWE